MDETGTLERQESPEESSGSEQAPAILEDDRRETRRLEKIYYVELHGRYGMCRGMVLNLSRGGALLTIVDPAFNATLQQGDMNVLGLRVAAMYGEGVRIRFREAPVNVDAELVRVNEGREGETWTFAMGVRFLRELTPAECALLGIVNYMSRSPSHAHVVDGALSYDREAPDGGPQETRKPEGTPAPVIVPRTRPAGSGSRGGPGPASAASERGRTDTPAFVLEQQDDGTDPFQALEFEDFTEGGREGVRLSETGPKMDVDEILRLAVQRRATDIHIKAASPIRVRIDGSLTNLGERILTDGDARSLVRRFLTEDRLWRFAQRGDLDMAYALEGAGRFRLNVFVSCGQVGMAIRRIPEIVPTIEDLGLSPMCAHFAQKRAGLVLVTGPTGSGKSTTLAAMVNHVNQNRACHIVTMEDPVEYRHREDQAHITQREIGRDTSDFAAALKRALRQDPDVIMVGEMRDLETMALAVTAAETGHLVFATLHTTGAIQTVDRIVDVFPAAQQPQIRMQLADSLRGVVSQVLVPGVRGGVVVAQEILVANSAVRALVREAKTPQIDNMMQTGAKEGMQTLDAALNTLLRQNKITYEAAASFARQPSRIERRGPRRGSRPPRGHV